MIHRLPFNSSFVWDCFQISAANETVMRRWLASQGFGNVKLAKSRTAFYFAGTVAQAQQAFHTRIDSLMVDGERHFANTTEISVPDSLSALIGNVRGLDDFRPKSYVHRVTPQHTGLINGNRVYGLAPGDIATIYDINSLYAAGIDGTGMKVAVAGQSDIDLAGVAEYRSAFGLPASTPKVITYLGDPGVQPVDEVEGELDVELLGAVARGAQIYYVISPGAMNALFYIVEQDLAPVVSMSYGYCENGDSVSNQQDLEFLSMQANAEGMTILVASGDSGAADCEMRGEPAGGARGGYAVDAPANDPGYTGVGGTSFVTANGTYFSGVNGANQGSAFSYIPEKAWNDSTTISLLSTGGGASQFFSKPAWQEGPGVPNDGARDVPDVAMFSMNAQSDGTEVAYLSCTDGDCATGINSADQWGGTSAATPVFAGIVTLLNQYLVSTNTLAQPGLGNINPQLYLLAQNSSDAFHDITQGNNIVPCVIGSIDCTTGSFGFSAGPGYDQATGLGSVDAYNLVHEWNNVNATSTSTTFSSSPSPIINNNTQVTLSARVTVAGGSIPTGNVTFFVIAGAVPLGTFNTCLSELGTVALDSTGTATLNLPDGLVYNAIEVYAAYAGTSMLAPSFSDAVSARQPGPPVALSTSAGQINQGEPLTLTAIVYAFVGQPGNVAFFNGSTELGTVTPTRVPNQIAQWTASITTPALPAGQDSITAYYTGDLYYAPSSSPAITVTVVPSSPVNTTTTLAASPSAGTVGNLITLTATVSPVLNSPLPAGIVTFFNGPNAIGSATLNGGVAILSDSGLPAGQNSITASYAGNTAFNPSISAPVQVTITAPITAIGTTTSLTATPSQALTGASIAITVTVTPASGSMAPAGSVNLFNGNSMIGTAPLNAGMASIQITTLPVGTDTLTASYQGGNTFGHSTSQTVPVTIGAPTNSAPVINSLSPAFASAGAAAFTLTVTGSGFGADSTVYWGSTGLSTTYMSALQLAGDQGGPITLRQAAQLLVQEQDEVVPVPRRFRLKPGDIHHLPLDRALARSPAPGLLGGPDRDAVEPAPELFAPSDRRGPPRQDEERRLEGVLGIMRCRQHAPANALDRGPVAMHQGRERVLGVVATPGEEPIQQLGVGQAAQRAQRVKRPDLAQDAPGRSHVHPDSPPRVSVRNSSRILIGKGMARSRIGKNRGIRAPDTASRFLDFGHGTFGAMVSWWRGATVDDGQSQRNTSPVTCCRDGRKAFLRTHAPLDSDPFRPALAPRRPPRPVLR